MRKIANTSKKQSTHSTIGRVFFKQYNFFLKRLIHTIEIDERKNPRDRNEIIKMHYLIYNQLYNKKNIIEFFSFLDSSAIKPISDSVWDMWTEYRYNLKMILVNVIFVSYKNKRRCGCGCEGQTPKTGVSRKHV